MHPDLERLWTLAGVTDDPRNRTPLDLLGLIPVVPLARQTGYECTPLNSITFGRTGGDGVHFGLLLIDGTPLGASPVVMSTPVADESNVIVGEHLLDFLALGCRTGFHAVESLAFHGGSYRFVAGESDTDLPPEAVRFLREMREALGLRPWSDVASRLDELERRFLAEVHWPPPIAHCRQHGIQDGVFACLHFERRLVDIGASEIIWRGARPTHLEAWCHDCDRRMDPDGNLTGVGWATLCKICFADLTRRFRLQ